MKPPDLDAGHEATSETVGWQQSSPAGVAKLFMVNHASNTAGSPLRLNGAQQPLLHPNSGAEETENDPVHAILGKFDDDQVTSSPPPVRKHLYAGSPIAAASTAGLYSPGFLRRAIEPPPKKPNFGMGMQHSSSEPTLDYPHSPSEQRQQLCQAPISHHDPGPDSDDILDWSLVDELGTTSEFKPFVDPVQDRESGSNNSKSILLPISEGKDDSDELDLSGLPEFHHQDSVVDVKVERGDCAKTEASSRLPELPDSDTDSPQKLPEQDDAPPVLKLAYKQKRLHRYLVRNTEEVDDGIILDCIHEQGSAQVLLTQSWVHTKVVSGDLIHVVGDYDLKEETVVVSNKQNLIVVIPDVLVSATTVADAYQCERQVILQARHRTKNDMTKPLVYGSIIHELIQMSLLEEGPITMTLLKRTLKGLLSGPFLESLCVIGSTPKEADGEISLGLMAIIEWARSFWLGDPRSDAEIYRTSKFQRLAISHVKQIEKEIWSPTYGLKGKIDATVEVTTEDKGSFVTALEIKTGRATNVTAHIAQVTLYSLLMEEHSNDHVPFSLLYYTRSKQMTAVPLYWDHMRSLIQKRNDMALYFEHILTIPKPVDNAQACQYCAKVNACALYAASAGFDWSTYLLGTDFRDRVAHLEPQHLTFFSKWESLLAMEGMLTLKQTRKIWCMSGTEREEIGECFSSITVDSHALTKSDGIKIRHSYIIKNDSGSFPESTKLVPGSAIIVSTAEHIAVSQGTLSEVIDPETLLLTVNQPLLVGAHYRIDYDEYQQALGVSRGNLISLLIKPSNLLDSVVNLKQPCFEDESLVNDDGIGSDLNSEQVSAIRMALRAKNYSCILGMPGTGKTTVIVRLIECLVSRGHSVFLSGFTNSSVDNVVVKLLARGVDTLRLGHVLKVHPDSLSALAGYGSKIASTPEDIDRIYMKPKVVAATSLGISSWLFVRRHFDYCILDEASQLTFPASIGPLLQADRFVLVGDHFQLSPLVRDQNAKRGGLGRSLFRILCEAHPQAVVSLTRQYRMAKDIMSLSSALIYNDMMLCGSQEVANQSLQLPRLSKMEDALLNMPDWLKAALDPSKHVMFVNTDSKDCEEEDSGRGVSNPGEAKIAVSITGALVSAGAQSSEIGIISVYRAQRYLILSQLTETPQVEVLTADQAQGRDKDCIIVSLVRSNDQRQVGDLLKDWRRINVSFTRAKKKLIVLGSRKTLKAASALERFLAYIERRGWMYDM